MRKREPIKIMKPVVHFPLKSIAGVFLIFVFFLQTAIAQNQRVFEELATHPFASKQPTEIGRTLATLEVWRQKIYIGYGDYDKNTGPIPLLAYDPQSNRFTDTLILADTEALYNFRSLGNALYGAAIDPKGLVSNRAYVRGSYETATREHWSNPPLNGVAAVHIFDIVTLNGSDLWLIGAAEKNATCWRSTNQGANWSIAHSESPSAAGYFARYNFAAVYNGKLYVQAREHNGAAVSVHKKSKVFDGVSWSDGADLLANTAAGGWRPQTFRGKLIYKSSEPPRAGFLIIFDGVTSSKLAYKTTIFDFAIHEDTIYVLSRDGKIRASNDLQTWQDIATAPLTARSLTILNHFLYVGTADAKLYRCALKDS